MLSFEKVMDVFADYLSNDDMYEIVKTTHGFTVLEWDNQCKEWTRATLCKSPNELAEFLLQGYALYQEYVLTKARRELNDEDRFQVEVERQKMLLQLHG